MNSDEHDKLMDRLSPHAKDGVSLHHQGVHQRWWKEKLDGVGERLKQLKAEAERAKKRLK